MEILNRVNEISFNSSLIHEMRAIRFVTQLIDDGYVVNGSLRRMRIHAVADDDVFTKLNVASKLDAPSASGRRGASNTRTFPGHSKPNRKSTS
jgi:hypothetical protein